MAKPLCWHCGGVGYRDADRLLVCRCVMRRVFAACLDRCRQGTAVTGVQGVYGSWPRPTTGSHTGGLRPSQSWGWQDAEFRADFSSAARRCLDAEDYEIFRRHFLMRLPYRRTVAQLNMSRSEYWQAVYRIEAQVGLACITTAPYPLWPIDEYFAPVIRRAARPADPPTFRAMAAAA